MPSMDDPRSPYRPAAIAVSDDLGPSGASGDWRESETRLLLSLLNLSLTYIRIASTHGEGPAATNCLMRAIDTYGSVKDLLPKLDLQPEQVRLVSERLSVVREKLDGTGRDSPAGE